MDWLIVVALRVLVQAVLSLGVLGYGAAMLLGVSDLGGKIVFCLIGIWAVRPNGEQMAAYLELQTRRLEQAKR